MLLKIDGTTIAAYPKSFKVTTLDLDNGESTVRTADGKLTRDRVAVKRQIEMAWGVLDQETTSDLLKAMSGVFFELYYPDPMEGTYVTKTFYVGNRPAPFSVEKNGQVFWNGIEVILTER